ncbi:MAG TPA: phospholipid carrier-dependent glycosyltransferase [Acidimicrobiales bacterium]|nr:phospholipid carrier-dependent glycosyltransferase [Acidimicrobiales bacterium]
MPAIYQDSAIYIALSKNAPFSFSPSRPNGYPVVLRALSVVSSNLDVVTAAQHLAGLVVGLLVYILLVRLGTRRWVASIVTALLVVDAYAVALEQDVLTEAFFTLTLTACACLMVATERRPAQVVASGALLAAATTMRVVGMFAVPFWIAYLVWLRLGRRTVVAGVAAVIGPLLAYCAFHAAHGHGFGFNAGDGWYLYGKVGAIVDCSGARIPERTRPLCDGPRGQPTEFYLYSRSSPAQVLFFGPTEPIELEKGWNHENGRLLRSFSVGIILAQPREYASLVLEDFFNYFRPTKASVEMTLFAQPRDPLGGYEHWFHMPWWIVTASTVIALLSVTQSRPGNRSGQIAFLLAMALSLLLGTAATAGFNPRYVIPLQPLLLAAGAMGIEDLLRKEARSPAEPAERAEPAEVSSE